jgi:DNA-binding MarR family transcriptional regulator
MQTQLTLADYQALAEWRYEIRKFMHASELIARSCGLEPRQYQLMLAIKGLPKTQRPRIGELAERLQIQHHSTVELVNRLADGGYIKRTRGGEDRREVMLSLTPKGEKVLAEMSIHHRAELRTRGPALISALKRVAYSGRASGSKAPSRKKPATAAK